VGRYVMEHKDHHKGHEMGGIDDASMAHHEQKKEEHPPKHKMGPHEGLGHEDHRKMLDDFKRRSFASLILTLPILALTPEVQKLLSYTIDFPGAVYILLVLSSAVYFYGGYPFFKGFFDELRRKVPGMMVLIAVAISVSYFYSLASVLGLGSSVFFWELATLIDIMLLGHWVEMRSVLGASRALEELVKIMPSEAHLAKGGSTVDVKVEELVSGDKILVKPGEKIPIDGRIVEGETNTNEAMLTGESKPVSKKVGDGVIGGALNGEGSIVVKVEKIGKDTYLNQVIALVKQAQESKSRSQDLANRAAFFLTVIAIMVGGITFIAWLLLGQDANFAIDRAVTVMVISCPHALGLAVPLVVAVSTALAARAGLLIRDRQAFERAKDLKAIVFDKTGTLTEGRFGVTDIVLLGARSESEVLKIVASLEANSEHPIAIGIVKSVEAQGIAPVPVEHFNAIPGKGVEGMIQGKHFRVVSPVYLKQNSIEITTSAIDRLYQQGKTVVFLLEHDKPLGAFALADIVRKESKEAVDTLKSMGYKCMMLTGDNKFVAKAVADELGLDEYFAEVLPHEKSRAIERVQKQYTVAMVGDGINDAPALVQADVGIAIGGGTDVAVESADIILVRNDPRDVVGIMLLSKKTYSKMLQNLLWATGYNSVAIPIAAGILFGYGIVLTPAIGAILMSISTVIVAINARLLKM
jgi:Cu2+-exporting ATPase